MSVIEELSEMRQQLSEELPPEENDRVAYKCLAVIWTLAALSMAAEAGMDWASQGTPLTR